MLHPLLRLRLQQLLLRPSRLLPVHPGIGYSFIAAFPINIAAQPVDFSMTADSRASSHFIDNQLLPGIEHKMNHRVQLDPPETVNVAGNHGIYGVGQGVLFVQVSDHIGSNTLGSFLPRSYQG